MYELIEAIIFLTGWATLCALSCALIYNIGTKITNKAQKKDKRTRKELIELDPTPPVCYNRTEAKVYSFSEHKRRLRG